MTEFKERELEDVFDHLNESIINVVENQEEISEEISVDFEMDDGSIRTVYIVITSEKPNYATCEAD
jgi:hypothetical protein